MDEGLSTTVPTFLILSFLHKCVRFGMVGKKAETGNNGQDVVEFAGINSRCLAVALTHHDRVIVQIFHIVMKVPYKLIVLLADCSFLNI